MDFIEPSERIEMSRYALKGIFDETDNEEDDNITDTILNHSFDLNQSNECPSDDSESERSTIARDEVNMDQAPSYVTQNYYKTNQGRTRWKSFRKK